MGGILSKRKHGRVQEDADFEQQIHCDETTVSTDIPPNSPFVCLRLKPEQPMASQPSEHDSTHTVTIVDHGILPSETTDSDTGIVVSTHTESSQDEDDVFLSATSDIVSKHVKTSVPAMHYLQSPTLLKVTSDGKMIVSEKLQSLGLGISAPEGVVPDGKVVTLQTAVCLNIGSSDYPEDVVPISPVLMIHPDSELQKPIRITMPCMLSGENTDVEALGIGVMKADLITESSDPKDVRYKFEKVACDVTFETKNGQGYATFSLKHFCYLQLFSNNKEAIQKAIDYCICTVMPRDMPQQREFTVYFCLTYDMAPCIKALEEQCERIQELKKKAYYVNYSYKQSFNLSTVENPIISANCQSKRISENGWNWCLSSGETSSIPWSSVDPWKEGRDLPFEMDRFLYPPSFKLNIVGSGRTNVDRVDVKFEGDTVRPLESCCIHLTPVFNRVSSSHSSSSTSTMTESIPSTSPEHQVIQENRTYLVTLISMNNNRIADEMFSRHLLNDEKHNEIITGKYDSDKDKARKILNVITANVSMDAQHFHTFMSILSLDPSSKSAVDKLSENLAAVQHLEIQTTGDGRADQTTGEGRPDQTVSSGNNVTSAGPSCLTDNPPSLEPFVSDSAESGVRSSSDDDQLMSSTEHRIVRQSCSPAPSQSSDEEPAAPDPDPAPSRSSRFTCSII